MNQISNSEIIIEKMNEDDNCEEIYTNRLRSVVRNINNKSSQTISSESWASKVKKSPDQMNIINIIANETKEREKRENNLVIFGLKESKEVDKLKAIE